MTAPLVAPPSPFARARGAVKGSAVLAVAAAIVGFLAVGQLQGPRRTSPPLSAESEGDLARILADLNSEADSLQIEIADLKVQLNELRTSSRSETAAAQAADDQLRNLEVLAGTVPVTGPGIVVTITDPNALLRYDTMIDVVQELRDAGAEAVAVNNTRVGVATAFAEKDGHITLGGEVLTPPFRIAAIGQPATLEGGLKIPGGAIDALSTVKGAKVDVARQAKVELPALDTPPAFKVAKPTTGK
jgi:uncharacterized protein YlxW (UPF0749 family)